MKSNKKNAYSAPSVEVYKTESSDVISTSGFNGKDHVFGDGSDPATASYET